MKNKLLVSIISIFFLNYLISQSNRTNIEYFTIFEINDSIKANVNSLNDKKLKSIIQRIYQKKAKTSDFIYFINESSFFGKIQYKQLVRFLNQRVKEPIDRNEVDLEYVKLTADIINIIANELILEDANKKHKKLSIYLKSISNKNTKSFQLAKLYYEIHNSLIKIIKKDPKGVDYVKPKAIKAFQLGDTTLALSFRDNILSFLIINRDLQGYIDEAKKSLDIESKLKIKTPNYQPTIANLLDALIYSGNFDELYIESKLLELYNSEKYHYKSISYYAKYLGCIPEKSLAFQRILKLFKTKDLIEFCDKARIENINKLNINDYKNLILECSRALNNHKYYQESFNYQSLQIGIAEKIYSSDLSQSIADFQTLEIELEKEFKVKQEKEKNRYYLIIIVVVAFFLVISVSLFLLYLRKSTILSIRNKEKDTLLREIHHRVKNNFELVNTLLELQSEEVENQMAKEKLSEGQSRISSMSLIHQKLYQTEYLEDLDFQEYIEQLVELILKSANKLSNTKISIISNGLKLDIDTAIPLGLILNELCTNSCKYAFSESNQNTLNIAMIKQDESFYKLTYSDSGTNEIVDSTSKPKGIGLLLIKSLTKQLQGKSSYTFNSGAHFEILFKNRNQRKEIE